MIRGDDAPLLFRDLGADQRGADLAFEIADRAAERGRRGVQPAPGRQRQAALFGDGGEKR